MSKNIFEKKKKFASSLPKLVCYSEYGREVCRYICLSEKKKKLSENLMSTRLSAAVEYIKCINVINLSVYTQTSHISRVYI